MLGTITATKPISATELSQQTGRGFGETLQSLNEDVRSGILTPHWHPDLATDVFFPSTPKSMIRLSVQPAKVS